MKTAKFFLFLFVPLYGISQAGPGSNQFSKADSVFMTRYYSVLSQRDSMMILMDLGSSLALSFGSDFKSKLQSKKLSVKRPLNIGSTSNVAIVGCKPSFMIDKSVEGPCEYMVVESAGLNISKDIAHLVSLLLKKNIDNKNARILLSDSIIIKEIPFEQYSFSKSFVAGPTKVWGYTELPDCIWSNGVSISRKPKVNKDFTFSDRSYINGRFDYILAIWPYMWFSGWAGYEEYSMYFVFVLIDGGTGQILGNGVSHTDKFCSTYCGMEAAWKISVEISFQLINAINAPQ